MTEPIDQSSLFCAQLTECGKHDGTDSLLLAAQMVLN